MPGTARKKSGELIEASRLSKAEWEALKANCAVGDFVTTYCQSPAIPKTSPNGLHFFAHNSDECAKAPESVWHKAAKALICSYLNRSGIPAIEEHAGGNRKWIADVFFEAGSRKVAVELQCSYQTLETYQERQARYRKNGGECYWLLYPERFGGLCASVAKRRIRDDFGGRIPDEGVLPCVPNLPFLSLETEPAPIVKGVGLFSSSLEAWVSSLISGSFRFNNNRWMILGT